MIGLKFKNIAFHYDDKTGVFTVITEKQKYYTFTNYAEAREVFLGEIERPFRRYLDGKAAAEGIDIILGKK